MNGRFKGDAFDDIDIIVEEGKNETFDFRLVATDGDNKTNLMHTSFQIIVYSMLADMSNLIPDENFDL